VNEADIPAPPRIWRNLPNAISIARLCATAFMLAALLLHRLEMFRWLLLGCLVSDFLDGWIARTFHLSSQLGAALDSIADVLTLSLAAGGMVVFERAFVSEHHIALFLVVGLFVAELIASLMRYGRPSSFHTLLAHISAYLTGAFLISLFFWGYHAWLFYPTLLICLVELAEELALVCLLPQWRTDVGGIYRLLTSPSQNS
jgi:CDP-diacylglycerol--glycerol-3-phosphate 3-phosphatidyltransferase